MGAADRDYEYKQSFRRKRFTFGQQGNALVALVILNIVVFLIILMSNLFNLYSHQGQGMEVLDFSSLQWFALPASLTEIVHKPWTILTFMFSYGAAKVSFAMLLGMLSNMLWLWLFGFILQDLSGNKYIFPVYIYGSLAGAVFFIIAAYSIPALRAVLPQYFLAGAGMGTMAIAAAIVTINHDYRIFRNIRGGMPIWILTAIYLLINSYTIFTHSNPGALAYIGAALAGFLFVYFLKRGTDTGEWMFRFYDWITNLFNPDRRPKQEPAKKKIFYNSGDRAPYVKKAIITQKRVDEILDKINQRGYDFLTDDEKMILKKASEEDLL